MTRSMMRSLHYLALVCGTILLIGCSAAFDIAHTGLGRSAQVENVGFFKTTDDIKPNQDGFGFPDYYYINSNVDWTKYKKVIVNDFSSLTNNMDRISGLQIPEFKNIRKDMPDNIAQSFDGSIFVQCIRSTQRIDHNDPISIRNLQADAVLFGNISEIKTGLRMDKGGNVGLTATQVEIKLVDRRTGKEIMKMINRSSTDGDKILMPIVRGLANILKKAKNTNQVKADKVVAAVDVQQDVPKKELQASNVSSANGATKYLTILKRTNVRAEYDVKSKSITKLKSGEKVEKIDESDKWFKIKTIKGQSGWILKSTAIEDK